LISLGLASVPLLDLGLLGIPTNWRRMLICSSVSMNDFKHLARSMPADGLEAQDVVPPRRRRDNCRKNELA
jgi:hypothetical protein